MERVHHKPIKSFGLEGTILDDSKIARLKEEYIRLLSLEMKLSGYVPRLDIDPDFTISYNEERNVFSFKLTIYGTFVGKKKSRWIIGIDGTKLISIQQNKLAESLQPLE